MMLSPDFICPECRGALASDADGAALACAGCQRVWPVVDGLPDFTGMDIYWGEFERPVAEQLVAAARTEGWRAAAESVLADRPELIQYIQNEGRANALSLVPLTRRGRLLDIGAGWGAITTAASRLFDHVYSIEAVRLRAQFTRLRLEGEGRANVTLAQASLFALPFAENSFDVILLNGILEWIGDWDHSKPPREAQRDLLRRLTNFLRPGGLLIVGIENRIGFRYLLGRRDHNNLWGTNLLPRPLASAAQRLIQGQPYRVYTYSMPGLRRLIHDGGFESAQMFAPMPGYNVPTTIVPLDGRGALHYHMTRRVSRRSLMRRAAVAAAACLERLGALRHIPADFLAVARQPGGAPDEPATLWDEARKALGDRLPDPARRAEARQVIFHGEHNPGRPVMIALDEVGRRPVALAKSASASLAPMLKAEHATLERLADHHRAAGDARIYPQPYGLFESPRGATLVMEALEGQTLFDLLKMPGSGGAAGRRFVPLVLDLAGALPQIPPPGGEPPDTATIHAAWREALRDAAPCLPDGATQALADKIDGAGVLRFQHGDLFSKNILIADDDGGGRQLRLVDWADSGHHLPPLFDAILFLATCWMECGDAVGERTRVEHARAAFAGEGWLARAWREAWERGKRDWNLSEGWTPGDVVTLALAVYHRRIAALKGAAHPETRAISQCLRALAGEAGAS